MSSTLRVLSLNVRGLNNDSKRLSLYQWLEEKKIDIICLQETFCMKKSINKFNKYYKGNIYHAFTDSPHSRGVCIMLNENLEYEFINKHVSDDGRKILINIKINGEIYTIVNMYAPNGVKERICFLKKSKAWIKRYTEDIDRLIVCGDMNCCMNVKDRKNENGDKSNTQLCNVAKYLNVKDTWREMNPQSVDFTFKDISRIDYILISDIVNSQVTTAEIVNVPNIPDHKGVIVLVGDERNRGKSYWKLNVSVLDDDTYKGIVTEIIKGTVEELSDLNDPQITWEMIKIRVKECSIRYSIKKSRTICSDIKDLENIVEEMEIMLIAGSDNCNSSELQRVKACLQKAYNERAVREAKAAQIRSKAEYIEKGERSTKYFLSLEKKNQINNTINSIELGNGSITTDREVILNETTKFYKALYKAGEVEQAEIDNYIMNLDINNILSDSDQSKCEGEVSESECYDAMKNIKLGKSPGDDGLPVEFYRTFWDILKQPLIECYKHSYEVGQLSESQKRAIITLIYKKGDKKLLKNYRPISLTNADYKILAFTLANRLHKVIEKLIGKQQTAYIKGRFIGNNIRSVLDIVEYTEKYKIPGLLLFLDFQKAFDSLEWPFMISVLQKFNFGDTFIRWVKTLYKNPTAHIKVNGYISDSIPQSRGIKQGCPISALIFILCVEILAIAINQNKDIKGINIPKGKVNGSNKDKLSQYADDTTVFLRDELQVPDAIDTIANFSRVSGLTLNLDKTEAMWIGSFKDRKEKLFGFKWSKTIRYLGIFIGYDKEESHKLNWINKLEVFQKTLDCWRTRDLTYFGKMVIIKTLGIAKLIYSATMLPIPEGICGQVETMIDQFLWKGRKRRIKKEILQMPVKEGGIGQIDIKSHFEALKASWVPRLLKDTNTSWSYIAQLYLQKLGGMGNTFCFSFINKKQFPLVESLPRFYQEVLIAFNKSKGEAKPACKKDFLNSIIWANRHFLYTINGEPESTLFNKHWIECGIMKMGNIISQEGTIMMQKLNDMIFNKSDVISTQSKLLDILKQYKHLFNNDTTHVSMHIKNPNPQCIITKDGKEVEIMYVKSRFFYNNIRGFKTKRIGAIDKWEKELGTKLKPNVIFQRNVKHIKEKKIVAFRFKLLHRILICGKTLYLWKKISQPECSLCKTEHTVSHMLYDCVRAKCMWSHFERVYNIDIKWKDIVIGQRVKTYDVIISYISFLLYKSWILEINDKGVKDFNKYMYHELHNKMIQFHALDEMTIYDVFEQFLATL